MYTTKGTTPQVAVVSTSAAQPLPSSTTTEPLTYWTDARSSTMARPSPTVSNCGLVIVQVENSPRQFEENRTFYHEPQSLTNWSNITLDNRYTKFLKTLNVSQSQLFSGYFFRILQTCRHNLLILSSKKSLAQPKLWKSKKPSKTTTKATEPRRDQTPVQPAPHPHLPVKWPKSPALFHNNRSSRLLNHNSKDHKPETVWGEAKVDLKKAITSCGYWISNWTFSMKAKKDTTLGSWEVSPSITTWWIVCS